MVILVCGGRNFKDERLLAGVLSQLHYTFSGPGPFSFSELWHGGASGADHLAAAWGRDHGVPVRAFPAHWRHGGCPQDCSKVIGRAAGVIRNQAMVDALLSLKSPCMVIAFEGGAGTRDTISRAKAANVLVIEVADGRAVFTPSASA